MFGKNFYHALLRKYIVLFGTLFNDIQITREDNSGQPLQTFKIPLSYGPREKFLARVEDDPVLNRPSAVALPRMSFEITGITYDGERKLPTTQKYLHKNVGTGGKLAYQSVYMPVPYKINIELNIMTKEAEDGTRIVEQILPYFTPDWTLTAHLLEDFDNYPLDIKVKLDDVRQEDTYTDGDFKTRRAIIWTISFTMDIYFFGPSSKAKIIKISKVNLYTDTNDTSVDVRITTQPGLDVNGNPTSDITQTIDPLLIDETDNYGYIVTIVDNPTT